MYGIETSDKLQTKRIAGRIVPAIATTTSAVAGLVGETLCTWFCYLTVCNSLFFACTRCMDS